MPKSKEELQKYWNQNIDKWGELYLDISHSHESLDALPLVGYLYNKFIIPRERRLMSERYRLTMKFIDNYVKPDMIAVDVGCGTGIFTVEMLKRGAKVKAVDFAQSSLDSTRALVEKLCPDMVNNVDYLLLDVSKGRLPDSDVVIAMGVTPYLDDITPFYKNILPTTTVFYCLILDPNHWANLVRRVAPFLNVRNMNWFSKSKIDSILKDHEWELIERKPFASGYLDTTRKI
jgi:SAM-dependent methyltransferase